MSEVFQCELVIHEESFRHTMTDDEYKNHIKKQLTYALAEKIMETNRANFTYVKNPINYTVRVIGRVTL